LISDTWHGDNKAQHMNYQIQYTTAGGMLSFHHGGKCNTAFVDGHVATIEPQYIKDRKSSIHSVNAGVGDLGYYNAFHSAVRI
jgi:prepilin-type processing-associated H-X9-DG protein